MFNPNPNYPRYKHPQDYYALTLIMLMSPNSDVTPNDT